MLAREINILKSNSFILFGSRGTGKTSLLRALFSNFSPLWIDLLDPDEEYAFNRDHGLLKRRISDLAQEPAWVVIDEVQRAPKLLDVVHQLVESTPIKFALTGSSARKLRRGGANLLAGRAFVYHLYPFTWSELGKNFSLDQVLLWGSLPKTLSLETNEERELFLSSYVDTYLREEIVAEQLVRNVTPFRAFLELTGQLNGEPINYSRLAREVRADDTTVRSYFEILEETLVGFRLPAYEKPVRKQQLQSPKFYLFDLGVKRAVDRFAIAKLLPGSSLYGRAFEHFIILEAIKRNEYRRARSKLSYLRTKDGLEVDLVVEKPGHPAIFVEIKSSHAIEGIDLAGFVRLLDSQEHGQGIVLSQDRRQFIRGKIKFMYWQDGLRELFE
jgi:predicted AAA+ superfamily ATPase